MQASEMGNGTPSRAHAFYTVSDSRYFPGAVALVNSLRLVGHDEPVFLVDAGLTPEQRDLIAGHATLVPAPSDAPTVFLTPLGPMEHPAQVAILLDADIIVTRPLTDLIEAARGGRLVGFVDNDAHQDRFFPEWSSALGLGALRRQPYLNAGQLLVPASLCRRLLGLWSEGQAKVGVHGTRYGKGSLSDPFYFADQDVLNAVVAAAVDPDEIVTVEHRLAPHPPFPSLRLADRVGLGCHYPDGARPYLLHHILAKPWLKATRTTVYSLLLSRLLLAPDVALRLEPEQLPLRLRQGWLAAADRGRADLQALVYAHARRQLGRFGIRTRLAARRQRHAVVGA
jgi:hypothetical protein